MGPMPLTRIQGALRTHNATRSTPLPTRAALPNGRMQQAVFTHNKRHQRRVPAARRNPEPDDVLAFGEDDGDLNELDGVLMLDFWIRIESKRLFLILPTVNNLFLLCDCSCCWAGPWQSLGG